MSVNFKDKDYEANEKFLEFVEDVYDGIRTLRYSTKYLKKHSKESDLGYADRLDRAPFVNIFRKSIDNLSALLLRKKPDIEYKVRNEKLVNNIDGKGSNIQTLLKETSVKALRDGMTYFWVDSQKVEGSVNVATASDISPFIKSIDRKDVISKRIGYVNGRAFLKQVVIKQNIDIEIDEFKVEETLVYVVLNVNGGKIYTEDKEKNNQEPEYKLLNEWTNNLGYIPLIPIYSAKTGYLESDIPLLDLGDMNIAHYNAYSNKQNVLLASAFPVAVIYGNEFEKRQNTKEGIAIGSETALAFNNKTEEGFEWKEINGQSLLYLEKDIEGLKKDMIGIASSILSDKSYMTATEVKISEGSNNLFLLELAHSIEAAINMSFVVMGDYIDKTIDVSVTLNKDFNTVALDPNLVDKITQMKTNGDISLETYWKEMIRGEILAEFDFKEEKERIDKESKERLAIEKENGLFGEVDNNE